MLTPDATELQLEKARHFVFVGRPSAARVILLTALALLVLGRPVAAQESPYIVTYDHYLEEPGNLEVEYFSTFGTQRGGNDFHAYWTELEYGMKAWWTTELYLDAQTTFNDSTIFTGVRWENRFRLLQQEHFINPVLYIEYEQTSEAGSRCTGWRSWRPVLPPKNGFAPRCSLLSGSRC